MLNIFALFSKDVLLSKQVLGWPYCPVCLVDCIPEPVQYSGADTSNKKVRIPSSVLFIPTTTTTFGPPPTPPTGLVAGLKEEVYYKIYSMQKVPTDLDKRSPSVTRVVKEPYYGVTWRKWQGFTQYYDYAVRWTGWVKISTSGNYEWCTDSNDGSKLYIDDRLVVNDDGPHGLPERCSSFGVSSGSHEFKAFFFQRYGLQGMQLKYSGDDTSDKSVRIASSVLFTA